MFKKIIIATILSTLTFSIFAQTSGTLTVSTSTSSTGGNYAPKNIIAIWIEDDAGDFVKTLISYAQTRITHLNTWQASTAAAGSEFNTVDAITGATRNSHSTRTGTWNGTDIDGNLVPDGIYHVWMELTDKNGTGNFSSFSFTKGTTQENLSPANVASFASISINWEPVITAISPINFDDKAIIYPNPSLGYFTIAVSNLKWVEIWNIEGKIVYKGATPFINISSQPKGIYFVKITNDEGSITKKIDKL